MVGVAPNATVHNRYPSVACLVISSAPSTLSTKGWKMRYKAEKSSPQNTEQ